MLNTSQLLDTLVLWLQNSWSCTKGKSVFSNFLQLDFDVRQGSILSPHLFAIYVDDVTIAFLLVRNHCLSCMTMTSFSPSVGMLQKLLRKCEQEVLLVRNVNYCEEIVLSARGPCCDVVCTNITTSSGEQLPCVKEHHYLGVYLVQSRHFRCTIHEHNKSFFGSVNALHLRK